MTEACRALLAAAIQAPSGDNTQPWRFVIEDGDRIAFLLDPTRDPSPMNSGQRMARIAIGAALENLWRTAERNGWSVSEVESSGEALAVLQVVGAGMAPTADPVIAQRTTNRKPYDGRPVPAEVLAALAHQTPPLQGVVTHWIVGRERLAELAALIGRCDATMFGEPSMRHAFLANVRFDAAPDAKVEEGLSLGSLELGAADRTALRLMRRLPEWLVRALGARKVFQAKATELIASSSGLCVVAATGEDERTDLLVGRAMQRAWLALTAHGLAAQPMMTLPVLQNALRHGTLELIIALGRDHVESLGRQFRQLVPELGTARPAFLLRFGYAPPPTARVGRRPVETVTRETHAGLRACTTGA